MNNTIFLMLLSTFSIISSLVTEGVKKLVQDKTNLSYNIVSLVVALIVGSCGCGIYYQLNHLPFTLNNIIYMMLMGLASSLISMTGFDKAKQTIEQLLKKQNPRR